MNPFGVVIWGEIARNNELHGLTDVQLQLDELAEKHECDLLDKHYKELENKSQPANNSGSKTIDISGMG